MKIHAALDKKIAAFFSLKGSNVKQAPIMRSFRKHLK